MNIVPIRRGDPHLLLEVEAAVARAEDGRRRDEERAVRDALHASAELLGDVPGWRAWAARVLVRSLVWWGRLTAP